MKGIVFLGDSLERIKDFSPAVRREVGVQLDRVQRGLVAADFKPLGAAGKGVEEIRCRDMSGAYRVIYIARLKDAVFVLHAFKKTTQRTSKMDIETAKARLARLRGR